MSTEATASQTPTAGQEGQIEESTATFEPVIKLADADKVSVQTGEEAELELFKLYASHFTQLGPYQVLTSLSIKSRAKLFRFDKESNEWKERGTGDIKLLGQESCYPSPACPNAHSRTEHKETNKIRLIMRRDKVRYPDLSL